MLLFIFSRQDGGSLSKDRFGFLFDGHIVCLYFFIEMFDFILNGLVGFFIMRRQVGFLFDRKVLYLQTFWLVF